MPFAFIDKHIHPTLLHTKHRRYEHTVPCTVAHQLVYEMQFISMNVVDYFHKSVGKGILSDG